MDLAVLEHIVGSNTWAVTLVDRIATSPPDDAGRRRGSLRGGRRAVRVVGRGGAAGRPAARSPGGRADGRCAAVRRAQDPHPQRRAHRAGRSDPRHPDRPRPRGDGRPGHRRLARGSCCSTRSCRRSASGSSMEPASCASCWSASATRSRIIACATSRSGIGEKLAVRLLPTYRGPCRPLRAAAEAARSAARQEGLLREAAVVAPGAGRLGAARAVGAASTRDPARHSSASAASGVCGTDLHAFRGRQPFLSYPRILGHELAVEVLEVGAGATEVRAPATERGPTIARVRRLRRVPARVRNACLNAAGARRPHRWRHARAHHRPGRPSPPVIDAHAR